MKTGGGVVRSHLNVHESNGRWKIDIYDLAEGNHVVVPLVEDSSPDLKFPRKYDLPLLDRLSGWTVEKRKRSNGKEDKVSYINFLFQIWARLVESIIASLFP